MSQLLVILSQLPVILSLAKDINSLAITKLYKNKLTPGFTSKYNINKLVFFEEFSHIHDALAAEKKIKGWLRNKKNELISRSNPEWEELYSSLRSE